MTKPNQAAEQALIQRVLAGDSEAFYALVSPCQGQAFRAAFAILQNEEDAEEVVQEAFFKAFKHLARFRGEAKFSTWLMQILINEARGRLRQYRRERQEPLVRDTETEEGFMPRELGAWLDDPEKKYATEEMRQLVRRCIAGLGSHYRVVLVMRDLDGFPNEEVADALSLSVPAVKSRLLRARLMLRERLAPHLLRSRRNEHGIPAPELQV